MRYSRHLNPTTPQTEALPGQVANSAGGFSFAIDKWKRLERFLVLGSEGGNYYASERKLTVENVKCVEECLKEDGLRTVGTIVTISHEGRAPKNDPALLALAIALKQGDLATKRAAHDAVPRVARTGTHLFHLAEYVNTLGGWGRLTAHAFGDWYRGMSADRLALQAIKYQSRDGWSHADVLRLSHPKPTQEPRDSVVKWMLDGWDSVGEVPHEDPALVKIWAFERAKKATGRELVKLIEEYGLPHECVPNEAKSDPKVWGAMLPSMGLTAIIRNLGKMTSVGLLKPLSESSAFVREQLGDVDKLKKARIHPLALLVALNTYAQGHGERGKLSWEPNQQIVNALDAGFYLAFKSVEPTNKRWFLAVDISGSMDGGTIAGMPGITPRVGAAAMTLVTAAVEPNHFIAGFERELSPLAISPRDRLDTVVKKMQAMQMGGTDCAAPMVYALKHKLPVDVFMILTDSETWAGGVHPAEALNRYRQKTGIAAKLVVTGMTANEFTVGDPNDAGTLNVVGFDAAAPSVVADFAR